MNNIDCERFVRGAQEIDRKRLVITRIISTVESLIKEISWRPGWKYEKTLFEVPCEGFFYAVRCSKRSLDIHLLDVKHEYRGWWGTTERANAIPASIVPLVYAHLEEIVEKTDEAFPEAKIRSHFEFFMRQAD